MEGEFNKNRFAITAIIYATLLLDNILLTVIGNYFFSHPNITHTKIITQQSHFAVPILPDYLASFSTKNDSNALYKNFDIHYIPSTMLNKHPIAQGNSIKNVSREMQQQQQMHFGNEFNVEMENGKVGFLLAIKAFVQLFFNPVCGNLSKRFGYKNIIFFGTINLLLASLCKAFRFHLAFKSH
jgi:MFS family permease